MLLGLDLGTTHCKAALYDRAGVLSAVRSLPTPTGTSAGHQFHDPEALWGTVVTLLRELRELTGIVEVECVGVGSMAEAGLLVARDSCAPLTAIIPWHDTRSRPQADELENSADPLVLFQRSGLYPSFKYGLAKILWLRSLDPHLLAGATWLSVADFVVSRLTGRQVTDPSLAARTYAFDIQARTWDREWIESLGLDIALFPTVLPSGQPAGGVSPGASAETGLPVGIPVAVSGHDHICALVATGIDSPGPVLDSMGTAESLLGIVELEKIGERELDTGLSFAPHPERGLFYWAGGLPASGGSVEWMRRLFGDDELTYPAVARLLSEAPQAPGDILYFPYLSGSGAPCHDQHMRAAFVGLGASDGRAQMVRAVLEGTAYETESIRRAAERLTGNPIRELIVTGGGARNAEWVQIKADVWGCACCLPDLPEATTLGAALLAGAGSYLVAPSEITAPGRHALATGTQFMPDPERHTAYMSVYENAYLPLQSHLRRYSGRVLVGTGV